MTREDIQLLFNDLCGRLPYGVMAIPIEGVGFEPTEVTSITTDVIGLKVTLDGCLVLPINRVAPYLRPMSSMTEEEKKEFLDAVTWETNGKFYIDECEDITFYQEKYDWLNAHHFDYRNLLAKGLAIEVTEENNPYKE